MVAWRFNAVLFSAMRGTLIAMLFNVLLFNAVLFNPARTIARRGSTA